MDEPSLSMTGAGNHERVQRVLAHRDIHAIEEQRQPLPVVEQALDGLVVIGLQRSDVPRNREAHLVGVQDQAGLADGVDGVGDVQIVRKALREVLPRMHGGVLGDERLLPALGRPELVMPRDFGLVVGAFVAEQLAALVEVAGGAVAGFDEDVLVVVADLVAEVTEHGPVGLAETHPQRLAVGVEGLDEIDRDHPVGMSDRDCLALAVARQQIEGQAAVFAPERVDGQADVEQLQDQPMHRRCGVRQLLLGDGVVGVGLTTDQRVGQAAPAQQPRPALRGPASCTPGWPIWCIRSTALRR